MKNSFGRVNPFEKGGIKKNYFSMTLSFASTLPFLHLGPASLVLVLAGRVFKAFFCPGIDRRSTYPVLSGYRLNLAPSYYLADYENLFLDKYRLKIFHPFLLDVP